MKTATSIPYGQLTYHQIQSAEKTFSTNVAPCLRIGRAIAHVRPYHPVHALRFFIISLVRALMLFMMTIIKILFAILFVLEILFRSVMSGIDL
jgi:hypothetical protein